MPLKDDGKVFGPSSMRTAGLVLTTFRPHPPDTPISTAVHVVSEVCAKHWGTWSRAARKEATKQRGEAREAQRAAATHKANIDSNQAFRACSTARMSTDKPAIQLGLPMLKSSTPKLATG